MGKQKDFRHTHHVSNKKKDKKFDKTTKPTRASSHVGFLKNVEGVVQAELESVAHSKKIGRKICKELERYPILAKAVFLGCERIVDNILEAGEDVNATVSDGSTPLIIAVENGYPSIVQKLLKKGADPKLLRQDGRNALMIAVSKNDNRSFTLIWNYWDKNSFWELNHSDSNGYTALTIAAEHGHSQFIKFFLSLSGIEIDKQTNDGATPLMLALIGGHDSVVKKLIASGSDVVLEDKNGATALCLAISRNLAEIKNLMIETLDIKSRDAYAKKRTELLTRPRIEDTLAVVSFCKDVLFPVILEIRRSFQDGVELLEKYQIFNNLLKCMDTYQQDMQFIKVAFHLSACLIYDKAEYSRYIVEELAEQCIQAKGLDFSLKVITNRRIKSFTGARGAAFLPIHACSQCPSGIMWLKTHYVQLHPFVKEFNVIFPTLVFWANGENVKAQILFDRFEEILQSIEKDLKAVQAESPGRNIPTDETAKQQTESAEISAPANEPSLDSSVSEQQQWHLVSNTKSSSNKCNLKPKSNKTSKSSITKNENKKKTKIARLQSKIPRKMAGKKNQQRVNNKIFTCSSFPALTPGTKFSGTGYADALKKNLTNEVSPDKYEEARTDATGSKVSSRFSSDRDCSPNISFCDSKKDETEFQQEHLMKSPPERQNNVNEQVLHLTTFESEDLKKMEELCGLWAKVSCSENPIDTMTNLMKMFELYKTKTESQKSIQRKSVSECFLSSQKDKEGHQYDSIPNPKNSNEILCYEVTNLDCETSVKMTNNIASCSYDETLGNSQERSSRRSSLKLDTSTVSSVEEKDRIHKASDLPKEKTHNLSQSSELDTTFESQSSSDMNCSKNSSEIQTTSFSSNENVCEVSNSFDTCQSYKRKFVENNRQDLCYSFLREEVKDSVQEHLTLDQLLGSKEYNFNILQTENEDNSRPYTDKNASASESFPVNEKFNPECVSPKYISEANLFPSEKDSELKHEKTASGGINFCDISRETPGASSLLSDLSVGLQKAKKFDQCPVDGICNYSTSSRNSVLHLIIDGKFSDFIPRSHKNKLNSKIFSRVPSLLPFNIFLFTSNVKLENLQKRVIMYQRTIFNKIATWMRVNNSCTDVVPTEELSTSLGSLSSYNEEYEQEGKGCPSDPGFCYSSRIETLERNKYLTNKNECNMIRFKRKHALLEMKMEVGKHVKALQSDEGTLKPSKSDSKSNLKNNRTSDKTKSMNTRPIKSNGLEVKKETRVDTNIGQLFFTNSTSGYKPQFIYCESTSRWYKILRTIESCVPLSSLLTDSTDLRSSYTECFLHELIYPYGKIVYSTKEEHTLRHGDFGTFLGLLSNGNPVVVREFPKSLHDTVILLTKKRRANHKNIAAFYPSNVMVTVYHTLKVTDYYRLDTSPLIYGVVQVPTAIGNSLTDCCWRPFELIAAATKAEARQYLASASDVQMTGMLIYYILSGGKHPFGFTDQQCQENIRSGRPELGPKPTDVESRGLVRDMIRRVPSTRPDMNTVIKHPYFWNGNKRFQFLIAVARKIEFYSRKPTKIFEALHDSCLEARGWTYRIHCQLLRYISESMSREYRNDFVDLLHFMAGVQDNFEIMSHDFKTFIQEPSFFILKTFPTIFMSVYSVIRDDPIVQRQLMLEAYF